MTPKIVTHNIFEYEEGFSSICAEKTTLPDGSTQYKGYVKDCTMKVGDFVITEEDDTYYIDLFRVSGYESGMVIMLINMFMDEIHQLNRSTGL